MRCSFSRRRMRFGQSVVEVAVIAALASAIVALASCAIGGRKGDEHGEGVHGIQDDSRAALDAQHLEYFYKQLSLALQDGGEMKLHRHYKEEGRSADLLQWLVRKEIIRAKDAQRLSGASGNEAVSSGGRPCAEVWFRTPRSHLPEYPRRVRSVYSLLDSPPDSRLSMPDAAGCGSRRSWQRQCRGSDALAFRAGGWAAGYDRFREVHRQGRWRVSH